MNSDKVMKKNNNKASGENVCLKTYYYDCRLFPLSHLKNNNQNFR